MNTVRYFLAVDLGKKKDATAIAVIEKVERQMIGRDWITYGSRMSDRATQFRIRHLERKRLGTSYTSVVERVSELAAKLMTMAETVVVVDATGVGEPVVDMLRALGLSCEITAVTITGSDKERRVPGGYTVPKQRLMTALQVAFEQHTLQVAQGLTEWPRLMRELMEMRATISSAGHVRYGARQPEHDDLALAVALGWWRANRATIGEKGNPLVF